MLMDGVHVIRGIDGLVLMMCFNSDEDVRDIDNHIDQVLMNNSHVIEFLDSCD